MIYGLDTHVLVWFFQDDPRLSVKIGDLLGNQASRFLVPTLVLCELHALSQKKKTDFQKILQYLKGDDRFEVVPLDEKVVASLPTGLDIHDAVIVATLLAVAAERKFKPLLITRDEAIRRSSLIETIWE